MKKEQLDTLFNNYVWRQTPCVINMGGSSFAGRRILLPLPPSDNERLMPARRGPRMISSPAYRFWTVRAINRLKSGTLPKFEEDTKKLLHVFTVVVMTSARRDAHNYEKSLFDTFEHSECIYTNDRQIIERHTLGKICKDAPCEYIISYISHYDDMPPERDYEVSDDDIAKINAYILRGYDEPGRKVCAIN